MLEDVQSIVEQVKEAMECIYCKGKLVRKKVSYTATRKGYHLIIDNVPAWVCEQCGEPLFDEETVDTVQEVLRGVDAPLKRLAILMAIPTSAGWPTIR